MFTGGWNIVPHTLNLDFAMWLALATDMLGIEDERVEQLGLLSCSSDTPIE